MMDRSGYYLFDADHLVGHADMDAQHRRMVHLLATAADAAHSGKDRNTVQRMFEEYVEYTKFHFRSEERLMQLQGYSQRELHMQVHTKLLSELTTMQHNIAEEGPDVALAAAYEWLMAHIERLDKDLGAFLREGVDA